MEKPTKEPKPNRIFKGRVIRAAIAEAMECGRDKRPLESESYCNADDDLIIGYDVVSSLIENLRDFS